MIVSCDYSIRKFADSKNFTGALIDKFRANGYNCSNIAAIAGPQCSFCDLSRCYALRHSFFTKSIPLMYNLKYLDVSWTSINNVECIADCLVLRGLNLSGTTQIVDYSGLSTLTTLQLLALRASNVGSIDFCSELLELRSLDIGYTAVNDLTPVAELTRLEELLLDHSGSKSRAYMLKNGFSWDEYLIHTTEEIMDTAEIPAEGSSITDGSLGRESGAEGDAEGVVLSARPESGEAPHVVAAAVIRQHSTGNISQLGDEDDSSGELHNENHDNDKSILSCSSTKSVPLRSGPSLAEAEALEDTDQLFIVSNLKLIHDLTHREHANLRVINANYTELGVEYYDSCLEAVHEDVCLEKHSLSHKLVEAIVHNNVDAARRFLQGGVYINERVGPWINDYFADIWHSTRGGADIPAVKSYGGFIGTPTHTTRDKRIHGTIPFFNCNHENIDWRPTYLHIALLFNTREILQLLVMMGADLGAQVWFSYIKFDMDNVVYTDAEVRHQLELQNRGPIKEGSFVFNPHTLAKARKTVVALVCL